MTRPFLAALMLAVAMLAACAPKPVPPETALPAEFTLELPQSGGRFILLQGEDLRIRLPANHSTGYRWTMLNEAPGVEALSLVSEPRYETETGRMGAGGFETWHFRATGTGPARLYFTYHRPFETGTAPARQAVYHFEIR